MSSREDKTMPEDMDGARSRIVDGALIFLSVIAVPALAASFYRMETIGRQPVMALHGGAALTIWTVSALRKRVAYRFRAGLIVFLTFVIGLGGISTFALSGGGQAFFIISVVFAALFFNARTAIANLLFGCLCIAVSAGLFITNFLTPPVDMDLYNRERRSWIAAIFGLTLLGGGAITAIIGVNRMLSRSVTALQNHSSQLAEEVASRTVDLEASRQRFEDFAAASSDRFWKTDAQHRFTYISDSEQNMVPHADQVLGKTRWEAAGIDPADSELWRSHLADLYARRPFREFVFSVGIPRTDYATTPSAAGPISAKTGCSAAIKERPRTSRNVKN